MRKSILLGLLATVLLPATINAAEEHAPRRPEKPYILILGKDYRRLLLLKTVVSDMVGQAFHIKVVEQTFDTKGPRANISSHEIAFAECVLCVMNKEKDLFGNRLSSLELDDSDFKFQMPFVTMDAPQLRPEYLINPKKALIVCNSRDTRIRIDDSLEQFFGRNIFQLFQPTCDYILPDEQHIAFSNWLQAQVNPTQKITPEDSQKKLEDAFPRLSDDAIANCLIEYINAKNEVLMNQMFELLKLRYTNPADAENIQHMLTLIRITKQQTCSSGNTVSMYYQVLGFLYDMRENLLQK